MNKISSIWQKLINNINFVFLACPHKVIINKWLNNFIKQQSFTFIDAQEEQHE